MRARVRVREYWCCGSERTYLCRESHGFEVHSTTRLALGFLFLDRVLQMCPRFGCEPTRNWNTIKGLPRQKYFDKDCIYRAEILEEEAVQASVLKSLATAELSVHSHLPPSVPADGGVVYAAQTQFMSVGRSHVISPRDGAFTLLAGSGAGCRPGVSSLFKRDLLRLASGLEKGRGIVSCRGSGPIV